LKKTFIYRFSKQTMFDVVVIGAGVNGSSTAYHLIKQPDVKKVLLLEQFPTPHTRGSSQGQTRVTRCLYYDEIFGRLSRDSFRLWRELEKEVNEDLLIQNGYLEMFKPTQYADVNYKRSCHVLQSLGQEYYLLSGDQVNRKFPPLNIPTSWRGIYEPGGGTLMASKCVVALQNAFVARGGEFRDAEIVEKIIPNNIGFANESTVTIQTAKRTYESKSVVITAGTFTNQLSKPLGLNLPLEVQRIHPCYWRFAGETPGMGTVNRGFPSWFSDMVYGIPVLEYPGMMKICGHWGRKMEDDITVVGSRYIEPIQNFIRSYMKNVSLSPSVVEECFYTVTPDNFFIMDVHPWYKNIVIGAGFCGGGFKMAPVTGSILGDLALGREIDYDLSVFRLTRFDGVVDDVKSKL